MLMRTQTYIPTMSNVVSSKSKKCPSRGTPPISYHFQVHSILTNTIIYLGYLDLAVKPWLTNKVTSSRHTLPDTNILVAHENGWIERLVSF